MQATIADAFEKDWIKEKFGVVVPNIADDSRPATPEELTILENKIRWLATWMIHHANHVRPNTQGVKVGGHQASSASISTIMTALYFGIMKPSDRIAVKPHASPNLHAIEYMLGNQTLEKLENFRALGGAQSYPSRTKDGDFIDFSTGSVGLGVAMTNFAALVQDYLSAKNWLERPLGKMIALVGDAELDEGNIYEALHETWKHDIKNVWWVIDYNRQSLDAVVKETLFDRIDQNFKTFGWQVVTVKYGYKQRELFEKPGGIAIQMWIDSCPNDVYSALAFQGGKAFRDQMNADLAHDADTLALIASFSDDELHDLMTNLGGHCMQSLLEAFRSIDHDRPVCFICYTMKGHGLPLEGHKDNHGGLMTGKQMETFRTINNITKGNEWEPMEGLTIPRERLGQILAKAPSAQKINRNFTADKIPVPDDFPQPYAAQMATQEAFGKIILDLARAKAPLADKLVTTSPDVTVTTNLGGFVNQRGLFSSTDQHDTFKDRGIPSMQKWSKSKSGQHVELGIAENNLFLTLAAFGLSANLFGERLIPIGAIYDPFVSRGLDALTYACYQDARFIAVGTPSGITLAAEGGAHQSVFTPLIGIGHPNLLYFEPAYADEVSAIMKWGFTQLQEPEGKSLYLRLSTRPVQQQGRKLTPKLVDGILAGGYWLTAPNTEKTKKQKIAIVYCGAVVPEVLEAEQALREANYDVSVLAITSPDLLAHEWHQEGSNSHITRLLELLPNDVPLITVLDGHPTTLTWLGGVCGHRIRPLGITSFGQSGYIDELYEEYKISTSALLEAANKP